MFEQEARDTATSAERLEELSNNPALHILIASNSAAPAKLLETLATDQDAQVRAAVASNPNTPWPTLEDLSWEFPRAFLHNPLGPIQMVVHPEQISTDGIFRIKQRETGRTALEADRLTLFVEIREVNREGISCEHHHLQAAHFRLLIGETSQTCKHPL